MSRRPTCLAFLLLAAVVPGACGGDGGGASPARAPSPGITTKRSPTHRRPAAPARPTCVPGGSRDVRVPILMYHVVNAPPPGAAYPALWVPKERFAAQMDALAHSGYQGVTLDAVDRAWGRGCRLPERPVVISFDDGYASQSTNAAPVLREHGWPGVLDLEVKNVGLAGGLTRRQVRKLIGLSWEIDSHTVTHPDVSTLGPAGLRREVGGSRRALRRMFHVPVDFFCYPAGKYDAAAQAAVRAAGYHGATTEDPGIAAPSQDRDALPRVRVNGDETAAALLAQLRGLGA